MSAPKKFVPKRKPIGYSCSVKCECENLQENWNKCSGCGKFNCDFSNNSEDGWTYDDDTEKWLCCDCSPEEDEEDEEDDNESVHSTCCMDCDESFEFEEPVPAADYHEGRHEMRCPKCRDGAPEKYAGEKDN